MLPGDFQGMTIASGICGSSMITRMVWSRYCESIAGVSSEFIGITAFWICKLFERE